jgi:hypothetical protein
MTSHNATESDEDDYGPALPPELVAARKSARPPSSTAPTPGSSTRRSPSPPPRGVIGPVLPNAHLTQRPNSGAGCDSDSDSDADIGPQPLPAHILAMTGKHERSGVDEFLEREARRKKNIEEANQPKKLVRDEWMLVPPKAGDLLVCAFSLCIFLSTLFYVLAKTSM